MQLITLSGVDGSGKSTQVAKLEAWYRAQGKKTIYFHAVQFSLPQAAQRFFRRNGKERGTALPKIKSSFLGIWLRKLVLCTDLWRFRSYVKRLEKRHVDVLLSDRYFYDTLVNIAYLDGTVLDTSFSRFARKRITKPDHAYYLRVTPAKVMQRDRSPEQGLAYTKDKSLLFDEAAHMWSFTVIDADTSANEVFQAIKATL